jgi:hypothetical protein
MKRTLARNRSDLAHKQSDRPEILEESDRSWSSSMSSRAGLSSECSLDESAAMRSVHEWYEMN